MSELELEKGQLIDAYDEGIVGWESHRIVRFVKDCLLEDLPDSLRKSLGRFVSIRDTLFERTDGKCEVRVTELMNSDGTKKARGGSSIAFVHTIYGGWMGLSGADRIYSLDMSGRDTESMEKYSEPEESDVVVIAGGKHTVKVKDMSPQ